MKLIFSIEAIAEILSESYKRNDGNETGGILIGPKRYQDIIIDTINSSAYAERKAVTYYQSPADVNYLNRRLKESQARGYDFKGYWHKHPQGMSQLSHGDLATCKEILTSPNYKINNFLIMCIVTETRAQKFPLFTYVTMLDNDRKVVVMPVQYSVMPKRCITEFANCFEPINLGGQYENNHHRQNYGRVKECTTNTTVWSSRGRNNNSKLPGKKEGIASNRAFSTPKSQCSQP